MAATALIFLIFGAFDIPFIVALVKYDVDFFCDYTSSTFALLFVVLSFFTIRVIQSLNKLTRQTGFNVDLMKEKNNLIAMLILFDSGYLLRFVLGLTVLKKAYTGGYDTMFDFRMATLCPAIFMDALPLLFVMIVHHRSFKLQKRENRETVDLSDDDEGFLGTKRSSSGESINEEFNPRSNN